MALRVCLHVRSGSRRPGGCTCARRHSRKTHSLEASCSACRCRPHFPRPLVRMAAPRPPLLRVLCLHGYQQNAEVFRQKTGSLRKALKNHCEFVFLDAPHVVAESQRGWWTTADDWHTYTGYETSLDLIKRTVAEQGPFDGVLGFSQGATMAAVVCAQRAVDFRFAILISGFPSSAEEFRSLFATPVQTPSLHVYGETDAVVSNSRLLAASFSCPTVFTHPGGHFVPSTSAFAAALRSFCDQFLQKQL